MPEMLSKLVTCHSQELELVAIGSVFAAGAFENLKSHGRPKAAAKGTQTFSRDKALDSVRRTPVL